VGSNNAVEIEEVGQAVQFRKKKSATKAIKNGGSQR
jgi:PiT family inorganic phosphate transporter